MNLKKIKYVCNNRFSHLEAKPCEWTINQGCKPDFRMQNRKCSSQNIKLGKPFRVLDVIIWNIETSKD